MMAKINYSTLCNSVWNYSQKQIEIRNKIFKRIPKRRIGKYCLYSIFDSYTN